MTIRNYYTAEQRKLAEEIIAEIAETVASEKAHPADGAYDELWHLQNEIGVEKIHVATAASPEALELAQKRLAILRDLLEDNKPAEPTLNPEPDEADPVAQLMSPCIRLYAVITLDSIRTGNRYAACTKTKPELPHDQYAIYELVVRMPEGSEIAVTDAGATIAHVDLYDCCDICTEHMMAWTELAWHTETHRIHVADGGVAGGMLKGAHVQRWMEI